MQFAVAAWARVRTGAAQRHTGADQRGEPYPQGLKIRVCSPPYPVPSFARDFFPTLKHTPAPYRGQGNGVLTAGRGTSFTHGSEFFREKIHRRSHYARTGAPRMRAYRADETPARHTPLRSWNRSPVRLPHNGNNPTRQGARGGVYARRHIAQEAAAIPGVAIVPDSGTNTP